MTAVTAGIRGAGSGRWRFVPLGLALVVLIAQPIQAEAHTFLVASSPAAGQRVLSSPQTLQLEFTQQVVLGGSRVELQTSAGTSVPTGALQRSADGTVIMATLPKLASGTYRVTWQALSEDGHISTGEFVFGVGASAVLPAVTSGAASPTDWPEAFATWVVIAGLAVLLGTVISRRWVWNAAQIIKERPSLYMVHVLVIAGTLQELTLTVARVGAGGEAITSAIATAVATQAGLLALLTLALTGGSAIGWKVPEARVAVPLMLAAGLAAQALRAHPGVSGELWQQATAVIHVVVAALWVGMLAHLVGVIWRRSATRKEISHAVRRYATLALVSAAVVVGTGIILALGQIRQPEQLVTTAYGRLLLFKAGLVLVALLAAAWARGFRIWRPRTPPLPGLRALTRVEVGLLISVVGVASLLGSVAPPAPLTSLAAGQPLTEAPIPAGPSLTVAGQTGWLEVYVSASQGVVVLQVLSPAGSDRADTLHLRRFVVHTPAGQSLALTPGRCGPGCFRAGYDWPTGTSLIDLTVDATSWAGGTLQLAVPWPPVRSDPALIARMVATLRAQRSVLIHERVTSGPGASAENQAKATGEELLQSFPYGAGEAYALPASGADREVVVYLPGSQIWMHLWIDAQNRLVRDVIVAPHQLLEHTFSYP